MSSTVSERVALGAGLLDTHRPNWWDETVISLDELNIKDGNNCVLGQVFGSYFRGGQLLFDGSDIDATTHGFLGLGAAGIRSNGWGDAILYRKDSDALTAEWTAVIRQRRTQALIAKHEQEQIESAWRSEVALVTGADWGTAAAMIREAELVGL